MFFTAILTLGTIALGIVVVNPMVSSLQLFDCLHNRYVRQLLNITVSFVTVLTIIGLVVCFDYLLTTLGSTSL